MNYTNLKILILEDNTDDTVLIKRTIVKQFEEVEIEFEVVDDRINFISSIDVLKPDIIISDYVLPGFSGLEALIIVQERYPLIPFIFVTGTVGEEIAAETILSGASAFVLKSNLSKLPNQIKKTLGSNYYSPWDKGPLNKRYLKINQQIRSNKLVLTQVSEFLNSMKKDDL